MKNRFIEKSLVGALGFFREAIFAQQYQGLPGLLQQLDGRVKLVSLMALLLAIALTKSIILVLGFYALSIFLAYLSKIDLLYFVRRVWIFIPLFSLFIALPAVFGAFSPGEPIFFSVTKQGLLSAAMFISRVLASVSFCVLLLLTTSNVTLVGALSFLRIPEVFTCTFTMAYRYIFIFIKTIEETYLAISSRLIGALEKKKAQGIIAWRMTVLWDKSRMLSEEVYLAMISRGYDGRARVISKSKLRPVDFWWLLFVTFLCAAIFYFDGKNII